MINILVIQPVASAGRLIFDLFSSSQKNCKHSVYLIKQNV